MIQQINTHATSILNKAVDEITAEDIVTALSPIRQKSRKLPAEFADRIETILDTAKAAKHIASPWENHSR
jgi:tagatose-1,6-bisphosphate aldolase